MLSLLLTTLASLTLLPLLSLCLAIATASLLTLLPRLSVSFILCLLSLLILLRRCLALSALAIGITLILAGLRDEGRCRLPVLAGRLGDLVINLIGEIFELALCAAQGRRFVAQDAPGRAFDTLAHLLDPLAGVAGRLGGIFGDAQVGQLLGGLERIGDLLFVRLSDRVVEILGQERLGFLGVLHRVSHLLEKLVEAFFAAVRVPR